MIIMTGLQSIRLCLLKCAFIALVLYIHLKLQGLDSKLTKILEIMTTFSPLIVIIMCAQKVPASTQGQPIKLTWKVPK